MPGEEPENPELTKFAAIDIIKEPPEREAGRALQSYGRRFGYILREEALGCPKGSPSPKAAFGRSTGEADAYYISCEGLHRHDHD